MPKEPGKLQRMNVASTHVIVCVFMRRMTSLRVPESVESSIYEWKWNNDSFRSDIITASMDSARLKRISALVESLNCVVQASAPVSPT